MYAIKSLRGDHLPATLATAEDAEEGLLAAAEYVSPGCTAEIVEVDDGTVLAYLDGGADTDATGALADLCATSTD